MNNMMHVLRVPTKGHHDIHLHHLPYCKLYAFFRPLPPSKGCIVTTSEMIERDFLA